jgi:hypothetical protein
LRSGTLKSIYKNHNNPTEEYNITKSNCDNSFMGRSERDSPEPLPRIQKNTKISNSPILNQITVTQLNKSVKLKLHNKSSLKIKKNIMGDESFLDISINPNSNNTSVYNSETKKKSNNFNKSFSLNKTDNYASFGFLHNSPLKTDKNRNNQLLASYMQLDSCATEVLNRHNRHKSELTVSRESEVSIIRNKNNSNYRVRIVSLSPDEGQDVNEKKVFRGGSFSEDTNYTMTTQNTKLTIHSSNLSKSRGSADDNSSSQIHIESIEDVHINFVKLITKSKIFIKLQENIEVVGCDNYNTVVHFDEVDIV